VSLLPSNNAFKATSQGSVILYGAVQTYVDAKHARGIVFEEASKTLRSFSKKIGDVPLDTITPAQILDFLNGLRPSYDTWCVKFSLLKFCHLQLPVSVTDNLKSA
jgi:hypothetical protein